MRHAVIMAGGKGSRLWPISRQDKPKQFQKLIGDKTLLQETFERIKGIIPAKNIWVQTAGSYRQLVAEQLPEINPKHIISEPSARGTAPATGLAVLTILKEDPEALLFGVVPADHYIGKKDIFLQTAEEVMDFLEENPKYIATIGIEPTEPSTGMGYIKLGKQIAWKSKSKIFKVESFVEKPNLETAEKFLDTGKYLWNGGYYLFNGAQIVEYYKELIPKTLSALEKFIENPGDDALYNNITSETFDTAISEKIKHLAVIPADMEWNDVGNWAAIHDILSAKGESSLVTVGENISNNSENTMVMGNGKLIATIGLKDVVVIDTDDVLLICHRDKVQEIKKIVDELKQNGQEKYL
jgi:mannose-1-phosphate guanylyltransferase